MPDTEIPEANDPFEKRVALTIAIIAIVLSFVENTGDNAKTEAIILTNKAANQWGYYQSKSIKENISELQASLLKTLQPSASPEDLKKIVEKADGQVQRYESEKADIKKDAEKMVSDADYQLKIDDRSDQASLWLQVAVVVCSVSILAQSHKFWYGGIILGITGSIYGALAFMM